MVEDIFVVNVSVKMLHLMDVHIKWWSVPIRA
jgi:hypothetical protein